MISQNCPKCGSDRVRQGYRPTPIWSKLLFRFHLLCDNCNWEFTGFAVPGTVTARPPRKNKRQTAAVFNTEENVTALALLNADEENSAFSRDQQKENSNNGNPEQLKSVESETTSNVKSLAATANPTEMVMDNNSAHSNSKEHSAAAELPNDEDETPSKKPRKVRKKIKIKL